jgi:hypothetical protein
MLIRTLILTIAASAAFGCSNTPRYAAPSGPADSVATFRNRGVTIHGIDGATTGDEGTVRLTPGTHTIDFHFSTYSAWVRTKLVYDFQAGHRYQLKARDIPFDFKPPRVEFTDEATGEVLGRFGPDGEMTK